MTLTWSREQRHRLMVMQPKPLVRHNGLLWTVYNICDEREDNLVTLQLLNVNCVVVQVPMQSCEIVTRPQALMRSVGKRTAFMEVQLLQERYVIGPTPYKLDVDGTAFTLSDSWVSTAPLCYWPAGRYKEIKVDVQAYDANNFYVFTILPPEEKNYIDCHNAMQHLNIRPDIVAACGNPNLRGSSSWTHTCTLAALGWAYIDLNLKIIKINNASVSVRAYKPSPAGTVDIRAKMQWALPTITNVRKVPISIGADLMGLRTSRPAEKASLEFIFSTNWESPVFEQRRCRQFAETHASLLTPKQKSVLVRVADELTPSQVIATHFSDVLHLDSDSIAAVKQLFVEGEEPKITARQDMVVTWALNLPPSALKNRPFTRLFFVHNDNNPDRKSVALDLFKQLSFENLYGAVWEYLVNSWSVYLHFNRKSAAELAGDDKLIFKDQANFIPVSAANLHKPNCNFAHLFFLGEKQSHIFYNRANGETNFCFPENDFVDGVFASQSHLSSPDWDTVPLRLGQFPFLHPSAPMRPVQRLDSNVWKIPVHPDELLEMAYGDGTYPNLCAIQVSQQKSKSVLGNLSGYIILDPPLPPQTVLDDLYKHINENHSVSVFCAALAAHGPVGVTGLAKTTWTVLYEYYNAMGVPQNAYMQYIALAYADEILATVLDVEDRTQNKSSKGSQWLTKMAQWAAGAVGGAVLQAASAFGEKTKYLLSFLNLAKVTKIQKQFKKNVGDVLDGEDIDIANEIDKFCKRVNTIMVGTIAGGYVVSRTNIQTIDYPAAQGSPVSVMKIIFENLNLEDTGFQKFVSMSDWWRELQLSPRRFVESRVSSAAIATADNFFDRFYLQKKMRTVAESGLFTLANTYAKHGKVDPAWTRRYFNTRNSHITYATSAYDVQLLYTYGRERPRPISYHSAELLTLCCTNGKAYEFWACAGTTSAVEIVTSPEQFDAVMTQCIRVLGRAPIALQRTPPKITPGFAISAPISTKQWSKPETWVSTRPALSGFGFINAMNKLAAEASQCQLTVPASFRLVLATATAKVYVRNEMIVKFWLSDATFGPRFTVNAPIKVGRARPPARSSTPGLFSSRHLMDLYA